MEKSEGKERREMEVGHATGIHHRYNDSSSFIQLNIALFRLSILIFFLDTSGLSSDDTDSTSGTEKEDEDENEEDEV